jgi:hypothetical protein
MSVEAADAKISDRGAAFQIILHVLTVRGDEPVALYEGIVTIASPLRK